MNVKTARNMKYSGDEGEVNGLPRNDFALRLDFYGVRAPIRKNSHGAWMAFVRFQKQKGDHSPNGEIMK